MNKSFYPWSKCALEVFCKLYLQNFACWPAITWPQWLSYHLKHCMGPHSFIYFSPLKPFLFSWCLLSSISQLSCTHVFWYFTWLPKRQLCYINIRIQFHSYILCLSLLLSLLGQDKQFVQRMSLHVQLSVFLPNMWTN